MNQRGQNMLLLVLTLLLLTLMVTMTLGIASRIRENHELQTVADAAAYSNAVVNARAYNNVAIINRLQVSYWVAMAADESLISYATYTGSALTAAINGLGAINCGNASNARDDLIAELSALYPPGLFDSMDDAAGQEARDIQGQIGGLRVETREGVTLKLIQERVNQNVAKRIVQLSQIPGLQVIEDTSGGLNPTNGPNGVSRQEAACDWGTGSGLGPLGQIGSGLCANADWNENLLQAALGSRANSFVLTRGTTPPTVTAIFGRVMSNNSGVDLTVTPTVGGGYWATGRDDSAASTVFAWGDDHGQVTVTVSGAGTPPALPCGSSQTNTTAVETWVKSTDLADASDQHRAVPALYSTTLDTAEPPDQRHTMGSCAGSCPSVWVRAVGFQEADPPPGPNENGNVHGQPKTMVAIARDYGHPAYERPWELNFRMQFLAGGPGMRFDNRGERLVQLGGPGLDISNAAGLATGMTYYHRKNRWNEHPNLLNPFWRATLAPVDVDRVNFSDVADVNQALFRGQNQWQSRVFRELVVNAGYRGLH